MQFLTKEVRNQRIPGSCLEIQYKIWRVGLFKNIITRFFDTDIGDLENMLLPPPIIAAELPGIKSKTEYIIFTVDSDLNKYQKIELFKDKVEKANHILKAVGLPKEW